ncbi:hypothetical protein GCM10027084_26460 [Pseudoxanthomonas sangjuensis]|uniref:winged helix-turn-helix domain-containing protein n=1 Tax=Pseudoxanthomonas sangjuensis TaxID=1503750 RepID=UPI001391B7F7|nr:winged helix-turn-helix domain-containing protein [Pseudoxanthomonas sangjuensis]KAF1714474.1 hypothetical protein CSC71_03620 [Pseudoxanthomonas sangjuensis]
MNRQADPNPPCVWRFGAVEVDERAATVQVAGQPAQLDWTCFAILLALLHAAGRPVGKDELLQAGWPGRIVHENSLAKAIGRLRQALGDDGSALETVHGHGYRLAPAIRAIPMPDAGEPLATAVNAGASDAKRKFPRPALLLAAAAALGLAFWLAVRVPGQPPAGNAASAKAAASLPLRTESPDTTGRILWVDDNPGNNERHRRLFEQRKIAVYNATNNVDALSLLAMKRYSLVISDMGRGRGREPLAGLKLLQEMRRRGDRTPFYVFTFEAPDDLRRLVAEAGGQGLADDPQELYDLVLPLFGPAPAAR